MEDNIYYIYRHIRLDKNEVFYIGLGKNRRAWCKDGRNIYWKNIAKKSSYEVEVILGNLTREQAIEKEMEFIKLYGRKDLGLGTLCNKTDGGDGTINRVGIKIYNKGYEKWGYLKDDILSDIINGISETQLKSKYGISSGSIHRFKTKYITDKSIIKEKEKPIKKERVKVKKERKDWKPVTSKWEYLVNDIYQDILNGVTQRDIIEKYNISNGSLYRLKKKYINNF
jgi:transposase